MSQHLQWIAWLVPLTYLLGVSATLRRRMLWDALEWAATTALGVALAVDALHFDPGLHRFALAPLGAAVTTLVAFLGWVIARYSRGNLAGESGERRFVRALLMTLASVTAVLAAQNFAVLIMAWAASSLALHPLLTHYADRSGARLAARKKFLVSRVAELCLVAAAVLLYRQCGTLELAALDRMAAHDPHGASVQIAATLLAAAVLLKSAQLPVHGWLMQVMEAPTSVSALLHAGVINLGGYVLIRLAPLVAASVPAQALLVVVGSTTAALAGLTMMTVPARKSRLAWSTCSQMGLMAAECGLGLYTVALLHLLAHALYKAHAFLSCGEAIREGVVRRMLPATRPVTGRTALVALAAGGMLAGGSAWLWRQTLHTAPVPAIALLVCSLGIATLLWNSAPGWAATLRNLMAGTLGMQLYLLWHVSLRHLTGITGTHSAPALVLYSGACFLALYLVQWRAPRIGASSRPTPLFAWVAAGYGLDEPLTRLLNAQWPWHNPRRARSRLGNQLAQREGGAA